MKRRRGGPERALTLWTTGLLVGAVLPQYVVASTAVNIREDFPFTDSDLGLAAGISFAVSALIAPSAGRIIGRLGIQRGIILATLAVVTSSCAMATLADSAGEVIALMALNGVGGGLGSPSFSALLARRISVQKQGTAFGMLTAAPQMAAFAGGLALPLIAEPFSWRVAFVAPACISLLCLAGLLRGGRVAGQRPPVRRERLTRRRPTYVMALATVFASAAGLGMRSFLVVFAVSVGFERAGAGILLAMTGLVAIVSRIGFGVLGDRRPGDALARASALMVTCALGFSLMAVGGDTLIVAGAVLAGGVGWGWQAPLSLAVVSRNPSATETAIGIQMSGFFAGAVAGPILVGLLAERGHYSTAWLVCCVLALIAAALALLARRQTRREPAGAGIPSLGSS